MAEAGALDLPGRRQQVVMDRLALEHDNLRAAIGWAVDNREVEVGLRLGTALTWFWCLRGELEEARETFARLLAMPAGIRPTAIRMRALESAGTIDYYGGRMDLAATRYSEQLVLARELGDQVGIADALFDLTFTTAPSEWPRERAPLDEAEAIYRAVGDERKQARVLWARGAGAKMAGRDDDALRLWQEAYSRLHAVDDAYYESLAASSLGAAALESGDREAAARWFVVAMTLARVTSDVAGETLALPVAAAAVLDLVGPEPAATMMGAYETLSRRFGVQPPPGLAMIIEQGDVLTRTRAALETAAFATAFQRGQAMGPEEAVAFVLEQVDRMSVPPARGMP
jgi:tetratricopeptide (TPR) repeat protein